MKPRLCSWNNTEANRRREGAWQTGRQDPGELKRRLATLASVANGRVIPGGQAWLM